MTGINEVRERLERACIAGMDAEYVDDVSALLADHARLQKAMSVPTNFDQQDLAGQSGAVAWHLIDRHANNWGEVGEMMEQWRAANSPSAGGAAMSATIIPADQWPEGADRHCWDANGLGFFHVPTTEGAQMWLLVLKQSHIPLPAGWDWRVPVMRPAAVPAIDLEQFRVAVEAYKFEGECKRLEFCFGPEPDKQAAIAQIADGNRLLALIDAAKAVQP